MMLLRKSAPALFLIQTVLGQTTTAAPSVTAISDCHLHGTTQFCMVGTAEYEVHVTATENLPAQYTGCHSHGSSMYCIDPSGEDVMISPEGAEEGGDHDDDDHGADSGTEPSATTERNCHFHAGVEHCVGGSESNEERSCDRVDREYNIPLRVGLLFVMLVASAVGVYGPVFLTTFTKLSSGHIALVLLKQFGTGVLLSTAFVHLLTHAFLMFTNPCLGELTYEGTTTAIMIAGAFLSFLVEYAGHRIAQHRHDAATATAEQNPESKSGVVHEHASDETSPEAPCPGGDHHPAPSDAVSAYVLEAGIVFHSLLIGLTCVVADDSFFRTLFAVIIFHQIFEGIALGTVIAGIPSAKCSFANKMVMGAIFTVITPIGMGIGIGVLSQFNGNDKGTIIAIGTLDALSAGILAWVAFVEMWARDWIHGGPLERAGLWTTIAALASMMFGIGIMSFLGKWA